MTDTTGTLASVVGTLNRIRLFIGHGRALEAYLIGVKLLFGLMLVLPEVKKTTSMHIIAFEDLIWWVPPVFIALPFFIVGVVQLCGLILNYKGYQISWLFRAIGAACAIFLWVWIVTKHIEIGAIVTGIMPFCVMSVLANILLWDRAMDNRLPIAGRYGQT